MTRPTPVDKPILRKAGYVVLTHGGIIAGRGATESEAVTMADQGADQGAGYHDDLREPVPATKAAVDAPDGRLAHVVDGVACTVEETVRYERIIRNRRKRWERWVAANAETWPLPPSFSDALISEEHYRRALTIMARQFVNETSGKGTSGNGPPTVELCPVLGIPMWSNSAHRTSETLYASCDPIALRRELEYNVVGGRSTKAIDDLGSAMVIKPMTYVWILSHNLYGDGGSPDHGAKLAAYLDVDRETVMHWFGGSAAVPRKVLLDLERTSLDIAAKLESQVAKIRSAVKWAAA